MLNDFDSYDVSNYYDPFDCEVQPEEFEEIKEEIDYEDYYCYD